MPGDGSKPEAMRSDAAGEERQQRRLFVIEAGEGKTPGIVGEEGAGLLLQQLEAAEIHLALRDAAVGRIVVQRQRRVHGGPHAPEGVERRLPFGAAPGNGAGFDVVVGCGAVALHGQAQLRAQAQRGAAGGIGLDAGHAQPVCQIGHAAQRCRTAQLQRFVGLRDCTSMTTTT
jgi:hypothetical protein